MTPPRRLGQDVCIVTEGVRRGIDAGVVVEPVAASRGREETP
jgi:hypothetical protein